jgi:hypothetical protein
MYRLAFNVTLIYTLYTTVYNVPSLYTCLRSTAATAAYATAYVHMHIILCIPYYEHTIYKISTYWYVTTCLRRRLAVLICGVLMSWYHLLVFACLRFTAAS